MIYRLICLCLGLLFSVKCLAIVNIENLRTNTNEQGFGGKVGFDFSGKKGNSDKFTGTSGLRFQWVVDEQLSFVIASYKYGESNGLKDTNEALIHFRHIWHKGHTFAPEFFSQLQSDEFRRLELRALAGGGLRSNISPTDNAIIILGTGAFYENEALSSSESQAQDITNFGRFNLYIAGTTTLPSGAELFATLYVQPVVDNFNDTRSYWQSGITFPVWKRIQFTLRMDITNDSQPPEGVKHSDLSYASGLLYEF